MAGKVERGRTSTRSAVSVERADVSPRSRLTLSAVRCYGMDMGRATNHLPPNRKASEQERAHFKRLGELEETVPKFGSRPPRQLREVLEELARHRAQWPLLPPSDDLAEHLAEREAMMRKSDAGPDEDVCDAC